MVMESQPVERKDRLIKKTVERMESVPPSVFLPLRYYSRRGGWGGGHIGEADQPLTHTVTDLAIKTPSSMEREQNSEDAGGRREQTPLCESIT